MPSPKKSNSPWPLLLLCLSTAILFSLGVRFLPLETGMKTYHDLFFLKDGAPLMTAMDSYYYLGIADRHLSEEDAESPASTPLPALLLASLRRVTGVSLETLAFYLPPLLALSMLLVYLWWGRELGGSLLWLLAALIGMGSYYWYTRTCLGRFDTDCLIPFFVYAISFLIYRFSVEKPWKRRLMFLVPALLLAVIFQWWWQQARYLNVPLLFFPYAMSLFFGPSNRVERVIKTVLLGLGLVGVTLVVFNLGGWIPGPPGQALYDLNAHFRLVAKAPGSALAGAVGQSISELQPASWSYLCNEVAGHTALLILSILGLGLLIKENYRVVALLAFPLLLGLASFMAERFLIYLIPIYALGLAYLVNWVWGLKPLTRIPFGARQVMMALLCVALVGLNAKKALLTTINPKATPQDVELALAIKKDSPPHAVIWNWWDSGYFLQFYTGRRTIIHGGNQNSDLIFITAFPLTTDDPVLARNWMKFFAVHGVSGLHSVNERFNDMEKSIDFLKTALARPENLNSIIARFGLDRETSWRSYLFPEAVVYLYLPYGLINEVYWWFYYGTWSLRERKGIHPAAAALPGHFSLNPDKGTITMGAKTVPISELYYVTLTPEPHTNGHRRYRGPSSRIGVIWIKEKNLAYLFGARLLNSLFTRLVLLNPLSPPGGFNCLKYISLHGGVWKVE